MLLIFTTNPFHSEVSDAGAASVSCWSGALFAQRNPSQPFVFVGLSLPRLATLAGPGVLQEPPRDIRLV